MGLVVTDQWFEKTIRRAVKSCKVALLHNDKVVPNTKMIFRSNPVNFEFDAQENVTGYIVYDNGEEWYRERLPKKIIQNLISERRRIGLRLVLKIDFNYKTYYLDKFLPKTRWAEEGF